MLKRNASRTLESTRFTIGEGRAYRWSHLIFRFEFSNRRRIVSSTEGTLSILYGCRPLLKVKTRGKTKETKKNQRDVTRNPPRSFDPRSRWRRNTKLGDKTDLSPVTDLAKVLLGKELQLVVGWMS
ncbi:hypothetical protein MUK42_15177 [Musa troglodytarum]|uniref:Uncharacterized protein n=1 Tax=Musa troglodytarum TaxID=320322 RepID=A0A9E7I0I0_9LILI|nr:hypothetical protein MUK42_15177 [Musa troglodytarum]URE43416.1 hypothetical protein MUK42_15177 [Musa troglodytarum]URE43422.1 hypothetical protein MUK42_15177 [Musa troglodytarum]URE43425.1 hypothetical protein MUK42_15177 [Musa troglodytarum]